MTLQRGMRAAHSNLLETEPQENHLVLSVQGFPGGSVAKKLPAYAGDEGLVPGLGRSLVEKWQPTPVPLPGKSHGRRSLAGYSLRGHKESDTTEQVRMHALNLLLPFHLLTLPLTGHILEEIRGQRSSLMLIQVNLPDTEEKSRLEKDGQWI